MPSPAEIAFATLIVFAGSTLQGSIGFGMGLLASPLLILIDERFVPAPILLSTFCLTTFLVWREWHAIDLSGLKWALVGRIGGTVLAATVLAVLPTDRMALLFGILILSGVAMTASGLRLQPVPPVMAGAGALSGIMGTIASVGGPPMALIYQHSTGARIRATMSSFFWIGTVLSLIALRLVGRFGEDELWLTAIMLPGLVAGFFASGSTARFIDGGYLRPAVLTVAGLTGLLVIVRQFL